jgi:hypothetical protein
MRAVLASASTRLVEGGADEARDRRSTVIESPLRVVTLTPPRELAVLEAPPESLDIRRPDRSNELLKSTSSCSSCWLRSSITQAANSNAFFTQNWNDRSGRCSETAYIFFQTTLICEYFFLFFAKKIKLKYLFILSRPADRFSHQGANDHHLVVLNRCIFVVAPQFVVGGGSGSSGSFIGLDLDR